MPINERITQVSAGEETNAETVAVPSFNHDGVRYLTNPGSGACSCPRGRYQNDCRKHVNLARAGVPLENAYRGILADGTPVIILDSATHVYDSRLRPEWSLQSGIWGFAWGAWTHSLCHDGEAFVVESTRHVTGRSFAWPVSDWRTWERTLPSHADEPAA